MTAAIITVSGNIATEVRREEKKGTAEPWCHFRLGCNERYYDRSNGRWVDGETSFYSVVCWQPLLATNVLASVKKGDPVLVHGKLRARQWRDDNNGAHYAMEIIAMSLGHDLFRGTSTFQKVQRSAPAGADSEEVREKLMVYQNGSRIDGATGEMFPSGPDPDVDDDPDDLDADEAGEPARASVAA